MQMLPMINLFTKRLHTSLTSLIWRNAVAQQMNLISSNCHLVIKVNPVRQSRFTVHVSYHPRKKFRITLLQLPVLFHALSRCQYIPIKKRHLLRGAFFFFTAPKEGSR